MKPGTPGPIREVQEVESVTGASVLVRRKAFYEAGANDERFYLYWEDSSLCLSMRKAGWKIFYTPHSEGIHDEHQSSAITPNIAQHVTRSGEIFRSKWAGYFEANPDPNVLGRFDYLKGKR
jgi:GT2 family glycosyltransferase